MHMKLNPYVSLNWHREFDDNFANTLCIQVSGKAELLDASAKEFEEGLSVYLTSTGLPPESLALNNGKQS